MIDRKIPICENVKRAGTNTFDIGTYHVVSLFTLSRLNNANV